VRNDAPTRTNLLALREELSLARLGRELLDQKRKILANELLALVDQGAELERKADESLAKAWRLLEDAALSDGVLEVSILAGAVNADAGIELGRRSVMGVPLPVVRTSFTERGPYYSPLDASYRVDAAAAAFREVLSMMGRLAELRVSILRLAAEVRRTARKANALEKIAVPELETAVRRIADRLEENERDSLALMKTVKARLEAAAAGEA